MILSKNFIRLCFTILLAIVCDTIVAQPQNVTVPNHAVNINFYQFSENIEHVYGYKFFFNKGWVKDVIITKNYSGQNLHKALVDILYENDINFYFLYDYAFVLFKDPVRAEIVENIQDDGDKIDKVYIGNPEDNQIGKAVNFHGTITASGESAVALGNVKIEVDGILKTISNSDGYYTLDITSGSHIIIFEATGREPKYLSLGIYTDGAYNVELEEEAITLSEVVIRERLADENFDYNLAGRTKIGFNEIQTTPAFLGEVDVLKSIQVLPGVTSGGEIGSGINVRGGSPGQNLILSDNMMIFNPTHLFGFFSAIHPDAIDEVNFYKGTIPAEFGGRLSSVIDIKQKEGDFSKLKLSGGIGLVSSRLMLNGPIIDDKLSFLIAARASYSDWILRKVKDIDIRNSSADFSDYTAKITFKPSTKDKLTLSSYLSFDQFQLANDTSYHWSNKFISLAHDHNFNNHFSSDISVGVGRYSYTIDSDAEQNDFEWDYAIDFIQFDSKFTYLKDRHTFTFGGDGKGYKINNGMLKPKSGSSSVSGIILEESRAYELGIYLGDEIRFWDKLTVVAGLRFSSFMLLGPYTEFIYKTGEPVSDNTVIDSIFYEKNSHVLNYHGLEPRLSLKYELSPVSQIKLGYSRGYQYLHLISNTTGVTPIDVWTLSNRLIKPQYGDQFSLGHFRRCKDNTISVSAELFYKRLLNLQEYRNGADLILNSNLEAQLISARGRAYGAEISIKKSEGRAKGTISYTYSRSERATKNSYINLMINDGDYFASNYDQPHNLAVNFNYSISQRHSLAVNFYLASGRPYTVPTAAFVIDHVPVVNYGSRNEGRMPLYHRLDITLYVKSSHKKNKWKGSWAFTLYNIYSRKNAYSIFFESDEYNNIQAKKLSILGSIFPAITYNFKL